MGHEWKVGDKIQLEGTVTDVWSTHAYVRMNGDPETVCNVRKDALSQATLIAPAAPKPPKLDVTKPMRSAAGKRAMEYLTIDRDGRVWVKDLEGQVWDFNQNDLENIPEPKIKGRREAVLLENGNIVWADDKYPCSNSVGRTWVEITEGDGMEELRNENIPEPLPIPSQIVELVNFDFGRRIMPKSDAAFYVNVASRAKVTYTEDEGWNIREVAS